MPIFRQKNPKKIMVPPKNAVTLDSKHKELVAGFSLDFNVTLPALRLEKENLKAQLRGPLPLTVEKRLKIQDTIKDLKKQIKELHLKEQQYFLNNAPFIFDYFDNKKKIAESEPTTTNTNSSPSITKVNALDTFFKILDNTADATSSSTSAAAAAALPDASSNNVGLTGINSLNTVQQYLTNVDEQFLDINHYLQQTNQCRVCLIGEMIPVEQEGVQVCNKCSKCCSYLEENEKPSYKEPPKEVCFYAYKRINHFREILAQFQAKESTQIPDEVIENINQQMKKERIKLSQVNNKRAKEILKKLGYNKYYEHIPFIKDKLGIKPPIMSADLENTLCNLFMDIQAPYAKFCPDDRVNFLNYYYTVYKLCELLDQQQFLPFFPMLKDREKRIEQDEIWRNICGELDWEYIPTV